jgi:16S rRNA (cytosine1402-N4)-methyltransferase
MHEPVLLSKVLAFLDVQKGETVLDGTLGAGGYAQALLERIGAEGKLIVMDRDNSAIEKGQNRLKGYSNVFFHHVNYSDFPSALERSGIRSCDKMILDLGLSRDQLMDSSRGFSFSIEGPLDMRLDTQEATPTLFELIHSASETTLADIIYHYGEERFARRIARAIVLARSQSRIETTTELAEIIQQAVPRRHSRIHPATRTFQALRIAVNRELEHLDLFLERFPDRLRAGGRLGIVSFHSLEDRRIKSRFQALAKGGEFRLVNKHVECADEEEIRRNPSSRSAKLRVIEKN